MKVLTLIYAAGFLISMALLSVACSGTDHPSTTQGAQNDSAQAHMDSAQTALLPSHDTLTYEQRQGKYLFTKYCAVCHGEEGKGDGFNAYNLDPKPRDFTDAKTMSVLTDEHILQTISGGGRSVNRSVLMPSWGGRLSKEEIKYLLAYIRLFASHSAP